MSVRPRQLARMGVFQLQEAVLDVLLAHYDENYGLGPADISKKAGIYRDRGPDNIMNDAIVVGILNSLREQNKVERADQPGGRGGWRLTEEEYGARRDDV